MSLIALLALLIAAALLTILPTGAFPITVCLVAVLLATTDAILSLLRRFSQREAEGIPPQHPASSIKSPPISPLTPDTRHLTPPSLPPPRFCNLQPAICNSLMLLFLLFMLLPLPVNISGLGNPRRQEQNRAVHETLATAHALELIPDVPATFSATRNRAGSIRWTLMIAAAIAATSLATKLGPRGKLACLRLLTLLGAAIAVAGIISLRIAPQGSTLWWIYPVPDALPGPVAAFRNQNHFAAFLAFLCPAALALLARDLTRARIISSLLSLAAFVCMSAGLVLSLSRGAILAYGTGLAACVFLFLLYRRRDFAALIAIVGALAAAFILFAPIPALRERLATFKNVKAEDSYQTRMDAWRDSIAIARDYPILGAGANGFRLVYPMHRTTTQGADMTHAENEYVQWAVDGGLIGLVILILIVIAYLCSVARPARSFLPQDDITIHVAALGGLAVLATNALFDFPLHIPLYTIPAAAVLGLVLPHFSIFSLQSSIFNFLAVITLTLAGGRSLNLDTPDWYAGKSLPVIARALHAAPTSQYAWFFFGERLAAQKTPESNLFARQCFTRAVVCDPNNYRLWDRVGYQRQSLGDLDGARAAFARVKELRDWMWVPEIPKEQP